MQSLLVDPKQIVSGFIFSCLFFGISFISIAQKTLNAPFPQKKMHADLKLFRTIRAAANSGVYKYRTIQQIDSIYHWANQEVSKSSTYGEFYNILWTITDFEGSLHNGLYLPPKVNASVRAETSGYFPFPVKLIEGKILVNFNQTPIPLGSEILSINGMTSSEIVRVLGKFYTTDGYNTTGKEIGISASFSRYYRFAYGKSGSFVLSYREPNSNDIKDTSIVSTSYKAYRKAFANRHSKALDSLSFEGEESIPYRFEKLGNLTGALLISSFSIGWNEQHPEHKTYVQFLDSIFQEIHTLGIKHLIVDVRHNGGGSDPNDLVTYSYLTDRSFSENKDAWVTFKSPPYFKYNKEVRLIGRLLEKRAYEKIMEKDFPEARNGKYYQGETSNDHLVRKPHNLAFTGNIYLLISPRTASAGSLFAAMVAGNENTTVIGRETQGGYYGHNGHVPIRYRLPHSKIKFMFSLVNLEQDVPIKENQPFGRGIMPNHEVEQSQEDFLNNRDVVMDFTLELINAKESGKPKSPAVEISN